RLEQLRAGFAHDILVIDEQDAGPTDDRLRDFDWTTPGLRLGARQVHDKGRPDADGAVDGDRSALLLDGPLDRREPEPGPAPDRLGREEGLEDPQAQRLVDPGPGVADPQLDEAPGLEIKRTRGAYAGRQLDVARRKHQGPALGHRVSSVDAEV